MDAQALTAGSKSTCQTLIQATTCMNSDCASCTHHSRLKYMLYYLTGELCFRSGSIEHGCVDVNHCFSSVLTNESLTQGWLFSALQVTQEGKEAAQTSHLAKTGHKTEHAQKYNFQLVSMFLVSVLLPTHVLSVFQKIVFCLKKLNLTAVMIQQIVPWVGSLLALLGISRQADGCQSASQ